MINMQEQHGFHSYRGLHKFAWGGDGGTIPRVSLHRYSVRNKE